MLVIFRLRVSATGHALTKPPTAIAAATRRRAAMGVNACSIRSKATILDVALTPRKAVGTARRSSSATHSQPGRLRRRIPAVCSQGDRRAPSAPSLPRDLARAARRRSCPDSPGGYHRRPASPHQSGRQSPHAWLPRAARGRLPTGQSGPRRRTAR